MLTGTEPLCINLWYHVLISILREFDVVLSSVACVA